MGKLISNQTPITSTRKYTHVNYIGSDEEKYDMFTGTHEEVPDLPTKTVVTVMGDHLYGSSIRDGIHETQFHYDGVHIVGS